MFALFYQAAHAALNAKRYTRAVGLFLKAEALAKTDFGRDTAHYYRRLSQSWESNAWRQPYYGSLHW